MQTKGARQTYSALFIVNGNLYATLASDTPQEAVQLGERIAAVDPDQARIAGVVQNCTTPELQSILAAPKVALLLDRLGIARQARVHHGLIVAWTGNRGWIIDQEGRSWKALYDQLLNECTPTVGALVSFSGSPHPANGHTHPLAWSIRVLATSGTSA